MPFIIGRKIEMTQQFKEDGTVVPVTLVMAEPNTVTQIREQEKDGYTAVQLGFEESSSLSLPQKGHLDGLSQVKTLLEFRVDSTEMKRGDKISVSDFQPGQTVDIVGFSKGHGFAGVMKRYGFKCKNATHGTKDQERMPGSIASQRQGKVIKGQRMAGHMGCARVTVKNLEVVFVDQKKNLIALKGALPGARGGLILIQTRQNKNVWQV